MYVWWQTQLFDRCQDFIKIFVAYCLISQELYFISEGVELFVVYLKKSIKKKQ